MPEALPDAAHSWSNVDEQEGNAEVLMPKETQTTYQIKKKKTQKGKMDLTPTTSSPPKKKPNKKDKDKKHVIGTNGE